METKIFADWFATFATNNKGHPMLLLFDGHMTHISIRVIGRALQDNIHVLKFPPHVTDIFQPLDKCCFGPLKRLWEKTLNERINTFGLARKVDKAEFVNILANVWHEGLNEKNVIAGFESTGIWPLNRDKYDISRFDIRLIRRYEDWVAAAATVTSTPTSASTTPLQNKSFEDIFLNRIKPVNKSPTKKRSQVNLAATIISEKELLQKLKEKETSTTAHKNKDIDVADDVVDDVVNDIVEESEESEIESSDDEEDQRMLAAPKNVNDAVQILRQS